MNEDLQFNINTRDLDIYLGDIALTNNTSVQNGSILKEAHCFDPINPFWGIGLYNVLNSPVALCNHEMNRWKSQAIQDGATKAAFTLSNIDGKTTDIEILISYE